MAPDSVLSMGKIELNYVLMLNWIIWNRTVSDTETVYVYETKLFKMELFWHLTVGKQKTILILNWIVGNLIRR